MQRYGIVSYNLHGNFTNYGSALQQYALQRVVNTLAPDQVQAIILDYCPEVLSKLDPLNPFGNLWDASPERRRECEMSLPAIKVNYEKFQRFFAENYPLSREAYTPENFDESLEQEELDGYILGSDTIWCIREFKGFEDGFYGNYLAQRSSRTVSYAASFGDVDFTAEELLELASRMHNLKAIGVREDSHLPFIKAHTQVPVERVLDPTLLLRGEDYLEITGEAPEIDEPYLLMYSRRYNPEMEAYCERIAQEKGLKIVDISLRAQNADRGHIMAYEAGVEEFLSLVKHAQLVVTNSFHGFIFAAQMHTPFAVFTREQASTKIDQLLELMGLSRLKAHSADDDIDFQVDWEQMEQALEPWRAHSMDYLRKALQIEE